MTLSAMMVTAMGGVSVRSIGKSYLKLFIRGDAFADGSAGKPDANPLVNLQGNTAYNLEEAVSTKQPHAEAVLGLKAFTFDRVASQESRVVGGSPNIADAGDEIAMWVAFKKNATFTGSDVFFEVGTTVVNTGFLLFGDGGSPDIVRAQAQTVSGLKTVIWTPFTDEATVHVQHGRLDSAGLHVRVDGAADVSLQGSFGGLANSIAGAVLGNSLNGSRFAAISVAQAVVLVNAPADTIEEMDVFINANPGVAA